MVTKIQSEKNTLIPAATTKPKQANNPVPWPEHRISATHLTSMDPRKRLASVDAVLVLLIFRVAMRNDELVMS